MPLPRTRRPLARLREAVRARRPADRLWCFVRGWDRRIVDVTLEAEPGHTVPLVVAARLASMLFVAASVLLAVLTLVDPGFAHNPQRSLAVCGLGLAVGTMCLVLARRMSQWMVSSLPIIGGLTIVGGMIQDRSIVLGGEVLLVWPLLAAYMMPMWVRLSTVMSIIVTFIPTALWILGPAGVTPSITMTTTLLITSFVLGALRRQNERLVTALRRQATTDGLTGLDNRRAFTEALENVRPADLPLSLALIDVDHFKLINDTDGHTAGDTALRNLGDLLAAHVREGDMVARFGGEEFVVLLRGCTAAEALIRTETLRLDVKDSSRSWARQITVSAGVATLPDDAPDTDGLLVAADGALYRAKALGRDQVVAADQHPVDVEQLTRDAAA